MTGGPITSRPAQDEPRSFHHLGIAVFDVERSIEQYEKLLGIERWAVVDASYRAEWRGVEQLVEHRAAIAPWGNLYLELVDGGTAGDNPARDWLERHGEGVYHVGLGGDPTRPPESAGPCFLNKGSRSIYLDTVDALGFYVELSDEERSRDLCAFVAMTTGLGRGQGSEAAAPWLATLLRGPDSRPAGAGPTTTGQGGGPRLGARSHRRCGHDDVDGRGVSVEQNDAEVRMPDLSRAHEAQGNIVLLEHVNLCLPDVQLGTAFYVLGLGCTRDPYNFVGLGQAWMNLGEQQFHIGVKAPTVLRGVIGLVVPDLERLVRRLQLAEQYVQGTHFAFEVGRDHVLVTCPWGNRFRLHEPATGDEMTRGMAYLEFDVAPGSGPVIERFYTELFDAPVTGEPGVTTVGIGTNQALRFRESSDELPPYDGHHFCIYLRDFEDTRDRFHDAGQVSEYTDENQFRCAGVADPRSGEVTFLVEHEVRSVKHPLYLTTKTNRDLGPASDGLVDVSRTESGVVLF